MGIDNPTAIPEGAVRALNIVAVVGYTDAEVRGWWEAGCQGEGDDVTCVLSPGSPRPPAFSCPRLGLFACPAVPQSSEPTAAVCAVGSSGTAHIDMLDGVVGTDVSPCGGPFPN